MWGWVWGVGSAELNIILNHDNTSSGMDDSGSEKMMLSRLKPAVKYKQKKVRKGCGCGVGWGGFR